VIQPKTGPPGPLAIAPLHGNIILSPPYRHHKVERKQGLASLPLYINSHAILIYSSSYLWINKSIQEWRIDLVVEYIRKKFSLESFTSGLFYNYVSFTKGPSLRGSPLKGYWQSCYKVSSVLFLLLNCFLGESTFGLVWSGPGYQNPLVRLPSNFQT